QISGTGRSISRTAGLCPSLCWLFLLLAPCYNCAQHFATTHRSSLGAPVKQRSSQLMSILMSIHGQRHLDWEACYNVRDLGGLPTVDGDTTRWRSIVRADILARLTDSGRRALIDYGVRTVIDLRSPAQVAQERSAFTPATGSTDGLTYLNLPLEA